MTARRSYDTYTVRALVSLALAVLLLSGCGKSEPKTSTPSKAEVAKCYQRYVDETPDPSMSKTELANHLAAAKASCQSK